MASIYIDFNPSDFTIERSEKNILRDLSARIAQLAGRDIENHKRILWKKHNKLERTRPLLFCDPENSWNEILTQDSLQCGNPFARLCEFALRKEIFWGEHICDDRVIEPYINMGIIHKRANWGLIEQYVGDKKTGSVTWISPLKTLDDIDKLKFTDIEIDQAGTDRARAVLDETLGDILKIRIRTNWYWTLGLTWELIKLRGLEQIMLDMFDNPQKLHRLMAFLRDGTIRMVESLQSRKLYNLNNEGDYVGSGGFGWSDELPASDFTGQIRTRDLWCLLESQETVGVSPDMFDEFVLQYQRPIMQKFGFLCYGCCEPLDSRWHLLKDIPNLRRVSVSPWADREKMAQNLQDKYIYSLKPHPGLLAGDTFEPEAVRSDIRKSLSKTRGCHLEIIMKDNHTIRNEPIRITEWVRIAREEIEK